MAMMVPQVSNADLAYHAHLGRLANRQLFRTGLSCDMCPKAMQPIAQAQALGSRDVFYVDGHDGNRELLLLWFCTAMIKTRFISVNSTGAPYIYIPVEL